MLRAVEGKNLTWQVEEQRHYLQRPHEQDPLLAGGQHWLLGIVVFQGSPGSRVCPGLVGLTVRCEVGRSKRVPI